MGLRETHVLRCLRADERAERERARVREERRDVKAVDEDKATAAFLSAADCPVRCPKMCFAEDVMCIITGEAKLALGTSLPRPPLVGNTL